MKLNYILWLTKMLVAPMAKVYTDFFNPGSGMTMDQSIALLCHMIDFDPLDLYWSLPRISITLALIRG
jgi:hypothetical protein